MISWAQRWRRQAIRWVADGTDMLFPPCCPWCRREGRDVEAGLCAACARDFIRDEERCRRCGASAATTGDTCPTCRRRPPLWDGIAILGGYADDLREAILRLKRPGSEDLAAVLASLLVEKHREFLHSARLDAVVPVPMHWWRRTRRGTSAAAEIARIVARNLHVGAVAALVRNRSTPMQNELPSEERPANVAGAFDVRSRVAGRRLLVVDDVVTTGATLAACCEALRAAGAEAVYVAALARADRAVESPDREAIA